jgi:hypothetical protein
MLWVEGEISSNFLPVKIYSHGDRRTTTERRHGPNKSNNEMEKVNMSTSICMPDFAQRISKTHVDGSQVDLGVTVLSGLGGRHLFRIPRIIDRKASHKMSHLIR